MWQMFSREAVIVAATLVVAGMVQVAPANIVTWSSGSGVSDAWQDGDNWVGATAPGSTDEAHFDGTASGGVSGDVAGTTGFNIVTSSTTVQKLTYGSTGPGSTGHHTTVDAGSTLLVEGDADGSLDAGDFTVGQDLSTDYSGTNNAEVVITGGGIFQVGIAGTNSADVVIGRRADDNAIGTGNVIATLDMSGLATFEAHVDTFAAAISGWNAAKATAHITLAQNNTIIANTIDIASTHNSGGNNDSTLTLGQTNTFQADNIYLGHQKTGVHVQFNTGLTAPTITITDTAGTGAANLFIGYNDAATGTVPITEVDLTGGSVDLTLNQLAIGAHESGGGFGRGELKIGAGTLTANNVVLADTSMSGTSSNPQNTIGTFTMTGGTSTISGNVTDGGGVSQVHIDGGNFTVTGDTTVDRLRVGYNSDATATLNGVISVGSGGSDDHVYVGRRDTNLEVPPHFFQGTLDMSGATSFTADVNRFWIATVHPAGEGQQSPRGDVTLADTSHITADSVRVGYSDAVGVSGTQYLRFGTSTTINADEVMIGGSKTTSVAEFQTAGSSLTLAGKTGSEADLLIGYQVSATGGGANGTANFNSSTFNATLDDLILGQRLSGGFSNNGNVQGTLNIDNGTVTINTLLAGATHERANASGTINLSGGTLQADQVTLGQVTGDIDSGHTAMATGTLAIAGSAYADLGSVVLGRNLATGAGSAGATGNITLSGGSLRADTITQHVGGTANFTWTGGSLSVDSYNVGTGIVQNGSGTVLTPGESIGTAHFHGDYTLTSGTWQLEVSGDAGADLVQVDGVLDLSGLADTLQITIASGTVTSQTFIIASYGTILGEFETVDLSALPTGYEIDYHFNGTNQIALVVPTPAALPGGIALLAITASRRRRR